MFFMKIYDELKEQTELLLGIRRILVQILGNLNRSVPVRLDQIIDGENILADITKIVGQTVTSEPIEKNAEGAVIPGLPAPGTFTYTIDNPQVGTLTQTATGATVLGIAAGDCNLSWTDSANPGLPASVKAITFSGDNVPKSLDQILS